MILSLLYFFFETICYNLISSIIHLWQQEFKYDEPKEKFTEKLQEKCTSDIGKAITLGRNFPVIDLTSNQTSR